MTLIIIDPESDLRQRLSALLSAHFGIETVAVASTAEAVGAANGHDVRAVLMGPGVPAADAFELAKTLLDDRPDIGVVLTAADVTTELLRSALRCGCSDVVVYNESDPAELMAALDEALEVVALAAEMLHLDGDLILDRRDADRQEAPEAESIALLLGEGRVLVQKRVLQEFDARDRRGKVGRPLASFVRSDHGSHLRPWFS